MKKISLIITILLISISILGCKKKPNNDKDKEIYYTVYYENTSVSPSKVLKDTIIKSLEDPIKDGYIFSGWYVDEAFSIKLEFPFVVKGDTHLFARFESLEDAFKKIRKKTIEEANKLMYEYTLDLELTYSGLKLNGKKEGLVKYNKGSNLDYLDEGVNSGALFFDGTTYNLHEDDVLKTIKIDSKNTLKSVETTPYVGSYLEGNLFDKALFSFKDEDLKDIKEVTPNKYLLNTSFSASQALKIIGNNINHPIISKFLGELPLINVETYIYVTFKNGLISSYQYLMKINVEGLILDLTYDLMFLTPNFDKINNISIKGLYLNKKEVNHKLNDLFMLFNNYQALNKSGYEYNIKTGVKFDGFNEINSSFIGKSYRNITSDDIYFHNDLDISSDFVNSDLYKQLNISNMHIKKTKLSDKSVYLIVKKLFTSEVININNYVFDKEDAFYGLGIIDTIKNASFLQIKEEQNNTTYLLTCNKENTINILNYLNNFKLDQKGDTNTFIKVFGTFDTNSINLNNASVEITFTNGTFTSLKVLLDGTFMTKYENSTSFTNAKDAKFNLSFELNNLKDGASFEPYKTVNEAK